jgi:Mrp family chromosome partitioning ATPase/capsular polysaccharide biosynthesis protein
VTELDNVRGLAIRHSLRVLWARLWLVVLVIFVSTATAFAYSNNQTRLYQASARLMYQPPTDISNPTSGTSSVNTDSMAVQLQSVGSSMQDPTVRNRAGELLGQDAGVLDYSVTASVVTPDVNTASASFPSMVEITAKTTAPATAAKIANAYAAAVIALRKEGQQMRYRTAQRVVEDQLKLYQTPQSKLTADYAILAQQLRNLQIAEATATGDFTVVIPAVPSASPVSPQPTRSAALGLAGGLIVGIALAFLISRFDTRVRTHREVAAIVGWPVLGRVPHIGRQELRDSELVALTEPDGRVSEALRMLRSSLEWANIDDGLRTLLVTSCVKGEGKTVTVCNLAVTLARAGKRVLVIDGDLRAPRVHSVFGLPNARGLTSYVRGITELEAALQTVPLSAPTWVGGRPISVRVQGGAASSTRSDDSVLRVLTSGPLPPDPGEVVASRRMATAVLDVAKLDADYILIDAPPILAVGDAGALSAYADGILLVTNLEKINTPLLVDGRERLDALPCRKVGIVVVGERVDHREHYQYQKRPSL